jgi:hypothetical protein
VYPTAPYATQWWKLEGAVEPRPASLVASDTASSGFDTDVPYESDLCETRDGLHVGSLTPSDHRPIFGLRAPRFEVCRSNRPCLHASSIRRWDARAGIRGSLDATGRS